MVQKNIMNPMTKYKDYFEGVRLLAMEWVVFHNIIYWEWVMQRGTTAQCVMLMNPMNKLFQKHAKGRSNFAFLYVRSYWWIYTSTDITKPTKLHMRKTIRLKSVWVFGLTNSPLSTAEVLIDAVGYVCSESVKCDDCLPQSLADELTLSLAMTLNQD